MLGPNTSAQRLRESLVVYGSARIIEGGAPILLQRLAHIYVGPDCEFPPPGLNVKPGYITHVVPARMRESALDRERTVIGARACVVFSKYQEWLADTLVRVAVMPGIS